MSLGLFSLSLILKKLLFAGDSIYRQKYEKLKREMDFMKKKLEQQHEEEMEKKDSTKKQLDRKVPLTAKSNVLFLQRGDLCRG